MIRGPRDLARRTRPSSTRVGRSRTGSTGPACGACRSAAVVAEQLTYADAERRTAAVLAGWLDVVVRLGSEREAAGLDHADRRRRAPHDRRDARRRRRSRVVAGRQASPAARPGSGEQRFIVGDEGRSRRPEDPRLRLARRRRRRPRPAHRASGSRKANGRGSTGPSSLVRRSTSREPSGPSTVRRIAFLADTRANLATFEITQAWSVSSPWAAATNAKERSLATLDGGVWGLAWGPGGLVDRRDRSRRIPMGGND